MKAVVPSFVTHTALLVLCPGATETSYRLGAAPNTVAALTGSTPAANTVAIPKATERILAAGQRWAMVLLKVATSEELKCSLWGPWSCASAAWR